MWKPPRSQEIWELTVGRLACVHMSGLLVAVTIERWPRWFACRGLLTRLRCRTPVDASGCPASRIDRSHHLLLPWQGPASARRKRFPPGRSGLGGLWRRRGAPGLITLPRHHHLPGDPGHLVGQGHGGELGRLALEQANQPGRSTALGL